ncbi:MAG TPA: guanylate kinase [Acidimicrobiia bacterium]|nr:guanylate kinase [Acidimicrobiia bacterium]
MLVVIAGPSGVGKGTIVQRLLERHPEIWYSVSATTRARRPGEVHGRDYYFLTRDEFERLQAEGGFLESFEVYGDLKGTPIGPIKERLDAGTDVLVEVDVQGALAVRERLPEAVLVFVRPPSRDEQRRRLVNRARQDGDSEDVVARRLAEAEAEEALADRFDHVVVNDDLDRVVEEISTILAGHRAAPA